MSQHYLTKATVFFVLSILMPSFAFGDKLNDQRQTFLQADKFLAIKNEAAFLTTSSGLADYPLYPYLGYEWLKEKLDQTDQILAFLSTYKDTRFAGMLRAKWLAYLAANDRWPEFVKHYEVSEDSADDCQYHQALFQTGKQEQALMEAKRLWLLAKKTDNNCQALFTALLKSPLITPDLVWQRFETALENNAFEVAKATSLLLKTGRKNADNWLQLHLKPELIGDKRFWQEKNPQTGRQFSHAIKRLANKDLDKAIAIWQARHTDFPVDSKTAQTVERKFGLELLNNKDSRAYSHLDKGVLADEEDRAAKVRAALLEQNWQHVSSALSSLTANEKLQPKWQYWLARALHENGNKEQARAVYANLAKDRSYYGFMAADTIKTPYQITDIPVELKTDELEKLADHPNFKACWEFKWLSKDLEARRQWQFAIKNLPKEKLPVAAKLAQQWRWDQIAITTLVKADYWDDLGLRFPLNYLSDVQTSAEKHQLDAALIYGLIRQESMLDPYAVSSVGALGLMQLMPQTAKTVAKILHEPWRSNSDLFNPGLNIHYGGYYFKDLLNHFSGHIAVAGAAYNAGPGRAKKWLPVSSTVPADIWIETIPFKETRKYVSTVLSYAMIYQHRLKKGNTKLKDLLRDIGPG